MKSPKYYIKNLELDIDPNLTDIDFGATNLDFEVDDSPDYDPDLNALIFESGLELDLRCYPDLLYDSEKDSEEAVGSIDIEVLVVVEGAKGEFENPISTWENEGYRETDWDFRYHIESGFITEVFSPAANLIKNSFRGVLPGIAFTDPPSSDKDELPVERTDFLRQYLEQNVHKELVRYLREDLGLEIGEEDIEVDVETLEEIRVGAPDGLADEYDHDDVDEIISQVFSRVVQQEAEEDIELASVEVERMEEGD